jgi:hypothetical protein
VVVLVVDIEREVRLFFLFMIYLVIEGGGGAEMNDEGKPLKGNSTLDVSGFSGLGVK